MMLDKLIEEGEGLKVHIQQGMGGDYLSGEEYATWISKCVLFLEKKYPHSNLTARFIKESDGAVGQYIGRYHTLLGIVKGIKDVEDNM